MGRGGGSGGVGEEGVVGLGRRELLRFVDSMCVDMCVERVGFLSMQKESSGEESSGEVRGGEFWGGEESSEGGEFWGGQGRRVLGRSGEESSGEVRGCQVRRGCFCCPQNLAKVKEVEDMQSSQQWPTLTNEERRAVSIGRGREGWVRRGRKGWVRRGREGMGEEGEGGGGEEGGVGG